MKLPANYVDVRMEQLLQRIQTNYETAKDEESKLMIIESLLCALDAIQLLTKERTYPERKGFKSLRKRIEIQSAGCLNMNDSKYPPDIDYAD